MKENTMSKSATESTLATLLVAALTLEAAGLRESARLERCAPNSREFLIRAIAIEDAIVIVETTVEHAAQVVSIASTGSGTADVISLLDKLAG